MNKLMKPKILVPLAIVLIALGMFSVVSINKNSAASTNHGHAH